MTIEAIVARYGLAVLFAGAALEGEAAVMAGGILAHKGLLSLPLAMLVAGLGSYAADQAWFYAGHHFRDHKWIAAARAKPAFARAVAAFERHPTAFIFAFRFLYGLRTVSPIAIGSTNVSARRFAIVNGVSASPSTMPGAKVRGCGKVPRCAAIHSALPSAQASAGFNAARLGSTSRTAPLAGSIDSRIRRAVG